MVAVLLEVALLLQRRDALFVRHRLAEVELLLAHRAEVAGCEVTQRLQLRKLLVRERRLEHPLEEEAFALVIEVAELQLEREPAHHSRVQVLREVRRRHHHTIEVLHLLEEFVHLGDFPSAARAGAVLQETVHLVEEKNGMLCLCNTSSFIRSILSVLLATLLILVFTSTDIDTRRAVEVNGC